RLDQRQRLDQPPPPGLGAIADQPFELAKGKAALRRRLGGDQIGKPFDSREIEPAVLEGTAGKHPPPPPPAAPQPPPRPPIPPGPPHTPASPPRPAMKLQLRDILAGLAMRRRKPQRQRFVDDFAGRRSAHPRQPRLARFGHAPDQRLKRGAGSRPADPHHG